MTTKREKELQLNINYRELVERIDSLQCSLAYLIEDADRLGIKFDRVKQVFKDYVKPKVD